MFDARAYEIGQRQPYNSTDRSKDFLMSVYVVTSFGGTILPNKRYFVPGANSPTQQTVCTNPYLSSDLQSQRRRCRDYTPLGIEQQKKRRT